MQDYLGDKASEELRLRIMKGDPAGMYKRSYLRSMNAADLIDPGMTWGELEDELSVVCYVWGSR